MACDCCNLPCGGSACCCVGDCCTEDVSCLLVSIDGCGTTEITAAGPNALCAGQTFSGTFTCPGGACGSIELKCGPAPDGIVARTLMDASCFRINANGNYECAGHEVPPEDLPYTTDSGWFGFLNFSCCPFSIDDCGPVAEICDCTCLKQEPVPRASSAVKCPPMGAAAMKRMLTRAPKETEAAGRLVERVGPFPHPCPRHRRLAKPCGRAQRGALYTPDQCHWCWWYENHSGYRMLWGGGPIVRHTWRKRGSDVVETEPPPGLPHPDAVPPVPAVMGAEGGKAAQVGAPGAPGAARPAAPTLAAKSLTVVAALAKWAMAGGKLTGAEELAKREAECGACEFFDRGTCGVCGCVLALKQRMATEHCPLPKPKW